MLNDGFDSVAVGLFALGVNYPAADGSRLIGQEVAALGINKDEPKGSFGAFSSTIAAFFERCADGSNF